MTFESMNFSREIKDAIKRMGYTEPTFVQTSTIPLMLAGHNVIVESHTGSGKTLAFGIPISDNILTGKSKAALVLCPTHELVVQVRDEIRKINHNIGINIFAFYGGHGMSSEIKAISNGIDILCATPGRLLDHFKQNNLDPNMFDTVVLDEADRMLDMGFIQDLRQILNYVRPSKVHLFSATLDKSVAKLIHEYIPIYEEVIATENLVGKNIFERHIKVSRDKKLDALVEIIKEAKNGRVLVFVSTKRGADFISSRLSRMHYKVEAIHGDKSQRSRDFALQNFKHGKKNILVATDVAARGLQIDNVEYVVNYDLANSADMHKHRIGRTGRMGEIGHAITFVNELGQIIESSKFHKRGVERNNWRGPGRDRFNSLQRGEDSRGRSFTSSSHFNKRPIRHHNFRHRNERRFSNS